MFGDVLRQLRISAGLSQKDIAKKVCVTPQAVSKWERNQSTPDPDQVAIIASMLGVSADTLLDRKPQNTDEDPQIVAITKLASQLNRQGLNRLQQYADDLVSSGKYQKISARDKAM